MKEKGKKSMFLLADSKYSVIVTYNSIQIRVREMILKQRVKILDFGDDHIVVYAGLFLMCALISALGGGWLGVLCFVPAAIVLELTQHFGVSRVLAGGN